MRWGRLWLKAKGVAVVMVITDTQPTIEYYSVLTVAMYISLAESYKLAKVWNTYI